MRARWVLLCLCAVLLLGTAASGSPGTDGVRITAAGDYGTTEATGKVLEGVAAAAPDAHLALGDLSYGQTGAEQAWCDVVKARVGEGFPFELVAGNHESNGQNGRINDFAACLPNQLPGLVGTYGRQYYVDVPRAQPLVRLVVVSPALTFPQGTDTYDPGSARYAWTAAAIDGAREAQIPWVVVGMHKPCLSVGQYSCDPGVAFNDLLIAKRVDLVLSGHEHHYARSHQLALGAECLSVPVTGFSASCVADSDDAYTAGAGTVFMTAGTGGVSLRDVMTESTLAPYFAALSGANLQPTYGFADLDVTPEALTAQFIGAAGTFSDSFSITKDPDAPPTLAPVAAFATTTTGLSVQYDGGGSNDPDGGTIVAHVWDFGDGEHGTGRTTTHEYDTSGTYPVKLTVTDDEGQSASVTQPVTVSAPPEQVLAADQFERTLTNLWGTADIGGSWTVSTVNGVSSVSGGWGRTVMRSPGARPVSSLSSVSAADVEVRYEFAIDKLPAGSGARVQQSAALRRVGSREYRVVVHVLAGGTARVRLVRVVSGTVTQLGGEVTLPDAYAAGDVLEVAARVSGSPTADLRAKVWPQGTPEPAGWTVVRSDSTTALATAGSVAIAPYLSSGATNAPIEARYDDVRVTAPGVGP